MNPRRKLPDLGRYIPQYIHFLGLPSQSTKHNVSKNDRICCYSPDLCGSVGWVLSHKAKSHQFDSRLGNMSGFRDWSLVRCIQEATNRCFFPSLSLFLPSYL